VSTEPWVTAAETAELVITLNALGHQDLAQGLFATSKAHRRLDGSYTTGLVYPSGISFPSDEATSYTAAAVVLAADALSRASGASGVLAGEHLPGVLDLDGGQCSHRH